MRRMMAAEVAAAKARGETISENTSTSDDEENDRVEDDDDSNISDDDGEEEQKRSRGRDSAAAACGGAGTVASAKQGQGSSAAAGGLNPAIAAAAAAVNKYPMVGVSRMDESCMSDVNSLFGDRAARADDDKGHEADMDDDTSMSSRASSRMMEESIDSMSAM